MTSYDDITKAERGQKVTANDTILFFARENISQKDVGRRKYYL